MSKRWPCSGLVFLRVAGHEQPTSCHKSFAASSLGVLIASQGSMAVAAPRWLACRPSTNKVPSSLRPGMQSSTAIQESKMKAEHTLSPPNCVKGQPRWPSKWWADWIMKGRPMLVARAEASPGTSTPNALCRGWWRIHQNPLKAGKWNKCNLGNLSRLYQFIDQIPLTRASGTDNEWNHGWCNDVPIFSCLRFTSWKAVGPKPGKIL